jgi:hypothetical protein
MIEKDGRKFKVHLRPDGFCSYEFSIYEIVPKKHWWSLGKKYLTSGTAYKHIKEEVFERLHQYLERQERVENLNREFNELINE